MKYTELNIKEGMPLADDAMRYLKDSLARLKAEKYECVLIIHGYGSTGKGGVICQKARQWLNAQVKANKIKQAIPGEEFEMYNFKAIELKNNCRELEQYFGGHNHGVTVVEL